MGTPSTPSRSSALITTRSPVSRQPGSTHHRPGPWPHTREELLPFLVNIFVAVAGALEDIVPHVRGLVHAAALLGPLELRLAVEEKVVQEQAAASAAAVCQAKHVGIAARMTVKERFTARISAGAG